jgi:y4mF family transcriptional regulator
MSKNFDNIDVIIHFHRKKSGLSQKELADLAGVGKTVIFDIEKGKDTIQLNTLLKILNVLNISITIESPLMKTFNIENEKIKNI